MSSYTRYPCVRSEQGAEESYPPAGADSRRERAGWRSDHPAPAGNNSCQQAAANPPSRPGPESATRPSPTLHAPSRGSTTTPLRATSSMVHHRHTRLRHNTDMNHACCTTARPSSRHVACTHSLRACGPQAPIHRAASPAEVLAGKRAVNRCAHGAAHHKPRSACTQLPHAPASTLSHQSVGLTAYTRWNFHSCCALLETVVNRVCGV